MLFFSGKVKYQSKFLPLLSNVKDKTVCIDIDNTLANVNAELISRGYDISQYPNPKLKDNFWKTDHGKRILLDAQPIKNTIRIAHTLINMGANPIFATKRSTALTAITYKWFQKHIKPIWGKSSVFYSQNKVSLNADIYFEDNPAEILEMLKAGKTVFTPTWSYNDSIFQAPRLIYYNIYRNEQHKKEEVGGYAVATYN